MKNYWQNLNDREKWMVALAAVVTIVYLFYLVIYAPITRSVKEKSNQLQEQTDTLEWIKQVKAQSHAHSPKKSIDNSQLLSLLSKQLKNKKNLKFPYEIQQTGSGDIQLSFNEIPFKASIKWLGELNEQYTLNIKQYAAEKTGTLGVVKLSVVISAGN